MRKPYTYLVCACALVSTIPWITSSEYLIRVAGLIVLWIGLAGCWNIMSGYTGYIDFGPVVYFGIGSYATALAITRAEVPFFAAVLVAGVVCLGVALPIGLSTLRLRGAYFAIATFAFAETMKQVTLEFDRVAGISFFQGSHGITLPPAEPGNTFFFFWVLAVTALVMVVHVYIERSKFGYGLKAIRLAEDVAGIAGVNTTLVKLQAYMTSAFFLGVFGGIEGYWIGYITPDGVYNVHKTVQMVIMTLLGGMGTVMGPVCGAMTLSLLYELLGATLVEYYLIIVGVIIVCVVVVMPEGLVGSLARRQHRVSD
ncbi:MAG: branched-chain amino acid ABC transporter permease [Thermodesulfobacteriota bacterium]